MSVDATSAEERTIPAPTWVESLAVFALAAAFTALVGALAATQSAVSWRALAAVSHAVDVLGQEDSVNLALIGFVEPPLPSLLHLPLAWLLPNLASTGQTVWVFGALVGGLTLLVLNAACADLGLGRPWRWAFCAVVALNPIFLGLMATGAPDGLYCLLLLGGGWALLRWQRREALRDLIGCSLFLGFAVITRYDAIVPALVATLVIATQTVRTGKRWDKLEGTLITFLLPIAYIAGLWILANRLIMGDAWYFWRAAWAAEPGAPTSLPVWEAALGAALAFPPLLAAVWWALLGGASERPRLALGAALVLLSPALALAAAPNALGLWVTRAVETGLPLLPAPDLFAPLLASTLLLTACALGDVAPLFRRKSYAKEACLAGAGVLLAVGCLSVLGDEERVYLDPRPAFHGLPLGADDASATKAVAARVQAEDPDGMLAIAGWPGYAVSLYARRVKGKTLLVSAEPPEKPYRGAPVGALLVRNGPDLAKDGAARRRWGTSLGATLPPRPAWTVDGWAYYPAKPSP